MSRQPFYVRFRGSLISASAVIIAMISMAMAFWTGRQVFAILILLTFPVAIVGAVIHFVDLFRRLRRAPDDPLW